MMGSEQRRLMVVFVFRVTSDCHEEVVMLGLREEHEEEEPRSVFVELLFSPASPSPSGSVLS